MKSTIKFLPLRRHTVFLTILLDLLSFGIAIPLLTNIFLQVENPNTIVYGLLISIFPLAQFFGSIFLGNLGDKIGKKNNVLISIVVLIIGYTIFLIGIFFVNIPLLFIGRLVKGFSSGNISTIQSILSDIKYNKEKTKVFGTLGVYYGTGVILDPSFGNIFSNSNIIPWFNNLTPFIFAIIILTINLFLIKFFFIEIKETSKTNINKSSYGFLNIFTSITKILKTKNVGYVVIVSMLNFIAFNIFITFFQYYLSIKFDLSREAIVNFLIYISILSAIGQGFLLRLAANKFKVGKIISVFSLLLAFSYLLFLIPIQGAYIYIIGTFIAIFQALTVPTITALIALRSTGSESLGVNQGLKSLGQTFPGLLALFINIRFVETPMIIVTVIGFLGWFIFKTKDQNKYYIEDKKEEEN